MDFRGPQLPQKIAAESLQLLGARRHRRHAQARHATLAGDVGHLAHVGAGSGPGANMWLQKKMCTILPQYDISHNNYKYIPQKLQICVQILANMWYLNISHNNSHSASYNIIITHNVYIYIYI